MATMQQPLQGALSLRFDADVHAATQAASQSITSELQHYRDQGLPMQWSQHISDAAIPTADFSASTAHNTQSPQHNSQDTHQVTQSHADDDDHSDGAEHFQQQHRMQAPNYAGGRTSRAHQTVHTDGKSVVHQH
ncbi:hypothetical protein VOLCADRAFT_88799 [Volvox carteri f. nagariensis]|uniref:Uncharacterized protein n=1 Tax=Volvox carteri f. nagariensis TaxID=3068 RepID=D8TPZ5_VOLCA|nr:uncharacterized protein VOLCADRAFT_88799 [Volvox carteri f. nagariensis]EFJ50445.1 hypothetical protein VOLCADRAFT_88799 [Volvox carteri f. nagariensis]|eukprot:XP_002948570.1 hypothetical protein VOLCADRAFT_88799 [Volvox carteri f. nagariensis]